MILTSAAVAGVSFAVRWFVRAGRCAALTQQAIDNLRQQNEKDRRTHDDLFRAVDKMQRDVSTLREQLGRIDARLTAFMQLAERQRQ